MPEEDHVAAARAVYDASVDRYIELIGTEVSAATETTADLSTLATFVDLMAGASKPVADVGCGPGRVAAYLAAHGLDVVGLDPSPAMVTAARRAHPDIRFENGSLDDLPLADGSLAGVACWYSIIHTPPERLGDAFGEVGRVLMPEGYTLVAFQSGSGEPVHRPDAHGTGLPLTSFRHDVREVTSRLAAAGFEVRTTTVREPELDHETTPQAFVIARKRTDQMS